MELREIVADLDSRFQVDRFEPDMPFSQLVPEAYQGTGVALEEYLEPDFLKTFHGLMVRGGQAMNKVFSMVFLSDEMLQKVASQNVKDCLLFSHHPLMMETSSRGFLPLSESWFPFLRENRVSIYVLHTPLDVHSEISTTRALCRDIGVDVKGSWCPDPEGSTGLWGAVPKPASMSSFLEKVRRSTEVSELQFIENRSEVMTVAVRPGGVNAEEILEAQSLGCDTLVTGVYNNLVQNDIGAWYRSQFEKIRHSITINLIECSHYASEAIVMKHDIPKLCSSLGLQCEFLSQEDPWQ